ncbi:MAG TPA: hypothetical protein VF678_10960, partial [bacterium]
NKATLSAPNTGALLVRWEQELDPVGYGVYLRNVITTPTFVDHVGQGDYTEETRLGAELLWGNMALLEEKPVRLPYQAGFQVDHLIRGFNVPLSTRYTLFGRLYF